MHLRFCLAVLSILAAVAPLPAAAHPSPDEPPTRVAVFGLKHDHVWGVLEELAVTPGVEVVAVGGERDDLLARARGVVGEHTALHRDLETMLDEARPDALLALVPNAQHLATLRAAARRGVHYYTHKPGATSARDAREMERLARAAGIVTVIHCYPVFAPENQLLFEQALAGTVGPLRKLVVMSGIPGPRGLRVLSADYEGWLYDSAQHGGGSLMDMGTYGLLYSAWLLGRPTTVSAMIARHAPADNPGAEDESWILLEYPGAHAVVQGSWSMPFRNIGEIIVAGPLGELRAWQGEVLFRPRAPAPDGHPPSQATSSKPPEPPAERKSGVAHFIDCIRNGTPVHPAFTPAVHVTVADIAEAAYRSARSGRRIPLR